MEEIKGYKAFNKDFTNRHGIVFEEGKTYQDVGDIKFGNSSVSGYHMCERLEDTLRYFPAFEDEIQIAEVIGSGKAVKYDDDYYGYYDMYAVEKIEIKKFLSRDEILGMFLNNKVYDDRVCRFVSTFKLKEDEIEMFKLKYAESDKIMKYIGYYQENDDQAFSRNKYLK